MFREVDGPMPVPAQSFGFSVDVITVPLMRQCTSRPATTSVSTSFDRSSSAAACGAGGAVAEERHHVRVVGRQRERRGLADPLQLGRGADEGLDREPELRLQPGFELLLEVRPPRRSPRTPRCRC